jgi:hypothetical protein
MSTLLPQPLSGSYIDGYLDRNGLFYACGYQAHRRFGPRLHAALFPEQPLHYSVPQTYLTPEEVVEFTALYPERPIPAHLDKYQLEEEAETFFRTNGWVKISSGHIIYFTSMSEWSAANPGKPLEEYPFLYPSDAQVAALLTWMQSGERTKFEYNTSPCTVEDFLKRVRLY